MKVSELKEQLKNLPDDMEVILQKDSEGNGYSPLYGIDPTGIYREDETGWGGEVYDDSWTADEAGFGDEPEDEEEWEELKKGPRWLILFPIN